MFTTFAVIGQSHKQKLESCAPSCGDAQRSHYDDMKHSFVIADVGLGVGAASAVVAAVLFAWDRGEVREQARARKTPRLSGAVGRGGGSLTLSGGF